MHSYISITFMHLKRLELVGFKSFAQKTVLDFPSGAAAIVGPNGSGKSNIIDAIRWLLGEREAKNMRSLKAEDLIFAGTPNRPRVSLAQATIVFDNKSRFFDIDFSEVAIRRRIERDGTSQFFLNDAEVRLKDVIDFFAKARLGTRGFSIINQGDSDLFVRALPKERRAMLEEILGLRQFQLKKHESELKLKNSRFNMEKVQALIDEILPHLKVLRRQATKWSKHADLKKELSDLEAQYFGFKLKEIESELVLTGPAFEACEKNIRVLEPELRELEEELRQVEASQPSQGKSFGARDKDKEKFFKERSELQREIGKLEAKIELGSEKSANRFDVKELVQLVEETREIVEDAILETDIKVIKKLLRSIAERINTVFENEPEEFKVRSFSPSSLEADKEDLLKRIAAIDKNLDEFTSLEREASEKLTNFNAIFRKAFEAVESKRAALANLAVKKNKIILERERANIRKQELARQASQVGRRLEEFSGEAPASLDLASVEKKILRLRSELAGIGEIDQGLLKEAEETENRYQFLESQLEDLKKAVSDLQSLIRELDSKIHNNFKSALQSINEEFQKYFRMMFGGGQAKLKIKSSLKSENNSETAVENNVEESEPDLGGIDIELNVPRKRIHSLDMLSGGEKSLVSLAVLFALISVSPPPFLVLDEVDAALDEANSQRFANLVKEFSKKSQFLVVTHNRTTMEAANVLYGVTMGEDGTSKVLSLKLE